MKDWQISVIGSIIFLIGYIVFIETPPQETDADIQTRIVQETE